MLLNLLGFEEVSSFLDVLNVIVCDSEEYFTTIKIVTK